MNALECKNPSKEVVGGIGSGLVGLHMKSILEASLPSPEIGFALRWTFSPGSSKALRCFEASNTETKKMWLLHRHGNQPD